MCVLNDDLGEWVSAEMQIDSQKEELKARTWARVRVNQATQFRCL